MNFLAHIYLSNDDPKVMVGNFIGDFVKGRSFATQYEPAIAKGIELHRMIDEFTDHHPVVQLSKNRLRPKYRHYAAVIVDIFYDHYLSKNWRDYHTTPLPHFARDAYQIFKRYETVLPDQVKGMLPYMVKDNWLVNYGNISGITQALHGISRRTRYDSKMNESVVELEQYYTDFEQEFRQFIPALKEYANAFLMRN